MLFTRYRTASPASRLETAAATYLYFRLKLDADETDLNPYLRILLRCAAITPPSTLDAETWNCTKNFSL